MALRLPLRPLYDPGALAPLCLMAMAQHCWQQPTRPQQAVHVCAHVGSQWLPHDPPSGRLWYLRTLFFTLVSRLFSQAWRQFSGCCLIVDRHACHSHHL